MSDYDGDCWHDAAGHLEGFLYAYQRIVDNPSGPGVVALDAAQVRDAVLLLTNHLHDTAHHAEQAAIKLDGIARQANADNTALRRVLSVLRGFAEWVARDSAGGGGIAPHVLERRALRALRGEVRTESLPPRRPTESEDES